MNNKIENEIKELKKELGVLLNDSYSFEEYLVDIWNSKYSGKRARQKALKILKYLKEKEVK